MTRIPPWPVSLSHAVTLERIADLRAEAERDRTAHAVVGRPHAVLRRHGSWTVRGADLHRALRAFAAAGARRGEPCPTC